MLTRAASSASKGSYSTVSGAVKAAGKGKAGEEESSPLMLIEEEAVVKARVMYWWREMVVLVSRYLDFFVWSSTGWWIGWSREGW